jgi:hypothetical protein
MTPLAVLTVGAMGASLGIMAFFSFVAAPVLFRTMERSVAGAAAAAVLPGYYASGIVLSGVALLGLVLRVVAREPRWRQSVLAAALTAVMLGLVLWSLVVVLPAAESARGAGDSTRFALAHRRAVTLNGLTMLCGALVLALEAVSRRRERPSASSPAP